MKKLLILFLVLVLVGCGGAKYVCEDGSVVSDVSDCANKVGKVATDADTKEVETKVEEKEEEIIIPEMDAKVRKIIDGKDKIKSLEFIGDYGQPDVTTYYVMDGKIMVEPRNKVRVDPYTREDPGWEYSKVILDSTEKTAIAFCDVKNCAKPEEAREFDYSDFEIDLTPLDWINKVAYAEINGQTIEIEDTEVYPVDVIFWDGTEGKMWIHNYYAVPYIVEANGEKYEFTSIKVNTVTEADFELPEDTNVV